jgi:hypothetical protein
MGSAPPRAALRGAPVKGKLASGFSTGLERAFEIGFKIRLGAWGWAQTGRGASVTRALHRAGRGGGLRSIFVVLFPRNFAGVAFVVRT